MGNGGNHSLRIDKCARRKPIPSLLAVAQIQDYLALTEELRAADPAEERVNVPGTVSSSNWSYRIPLPLEELAANTGLAAAVREVVAARGHAGGRS